MSKRCQPGDPTSPFRLGHRPSVGLCKLLWNIAKGVRLSGLPINPVLTIETSSSGSARPGRAESGERGRPLRSWLGPPTAPGRKANKATHLATGRRRGRGGRRLGNQQWHELKSFWGVIFRLLFHLLFLEFVRKALAPNQPSSFTDLSAMFPHPRHPPAGLSAESRGGLHREARAIHREALVGLAIQGEECLGSAGRIRAAGPLLAELSCLGE